MYACECEEAYADIYVGCMQINRYTHIWMRCPISPSQFSSRYIYVCICITVHTLCIYACSWKYE